MLAIHDRQRGNVDKVINIPNDKGHAPYDTFWHNRLIRNVITDWKGISVKPVPAPEWGGKKGKGRGAGVKYGVTPEHPWNRQYWK